jgi:hypothetical protein
MTLKTWKRGLVFVVNAVIAISCMLLIGRGILHPGGERAMTWHNTLQLSLVILSCFSWCALVRSVSKRQVFYISLVTVVGQGVLAYDTVWHCRGIHAILRLLGGILIVVLTAIMRKLSARLGAAAATTATTTTQVTHAQKALLGALYGNAALTLAFPDLILFQVLELCLFTLMVMNGWEHFLTFLLTSKEAFNAVSSAASLGNSTKTGSLKSALAPQAIKAANRARQNIAGNMVLCHFFIHYIFVEAILLNPFFYPSDLSCHERSPEDEKLLVDSIRFYLTDVVHMIIVGGIWHTIIVFKEASKKKSEEKKGTSRKKKKKLKRGPSKEMIAIVAVTGRKKPPPDLAETIDAPPSSDSRSSSRQELDYPMMLNL